MYLSFSELKALAELQSLRDAQVFVPLEFRFQRLNLRGCERGAWPLLPFVIANRAAAFFLSVSIHTCRGVGTAAAGARFCKHMEKLTLFLSGSYLQALASVKNDN